MQIKKIRVNGRDNIVKLAALIGLGAFVAEMLEMEAIVSVLFACSFVCVAANYLTFISVRKRLRLDDLALFLLTLLSLVLSDWQLQFDYLKPAIIVLCSILCMDQCAEISVSEKTKRYIQLSLILVCVVTNFQYYYGGLRSVYFGSTKLISLNVGNPNETAIWLVFLIVLLGDAISVPQGGVRKLTTFLCMVSLLPILYKTQSRNCFFAVLFYFTCKFALRLFKIGKLRKWFVFLITITPIMVYVGYMYVFIPNYDRFSQWFLFLLSEGKPLTGRVQIWSPREMNQVKHFLVGNYAIYHTEQLHNSMLTLYCRFGAPFLGIVCRKFYKLLTKMPNAGMQLALATVWLTGCFEASFFVGVAGMYMLVLLLPVFHQPERHPLKTEENE